MVYIVTQTLQIIFKLNGVCANTVHALSSLEIIHVAVIAGLFVPIKAVTICHGVTDRNIIDFLFGSECSDRAEAQDHADCKGHSQSGAPHLGNSFHCVYLLN